MLRFNYSLITLSVIVFIIIVSYLFKKRNKSFAYLLFWSIFYIYVVNVIKYTQFPIFVTGFPFEYNFSDYIEIIPTNPLGQNFSTTFYNILLTVPFGFGIPFLRKINWKKIFLFTLLFSTSIEILQLFAHLIFDGHNRIVAINDLIYNTIGGVIGYLLFLLFARVYNIVIKRNNHKMDPIQSYIFQKTSGK